MFRLEHRPVRDNFMKLERRAYTNSPSECALVHAPQIDVVSLSQSKLVVVAIREGRFPSSETFPCQLPKSQ